MKIIGHRGAAGSELENTLASIKAAVDMGVYAIEIDVRKTRDDQLVILHDPKLSRVANDKRKIKKLRLKQVQRVALHSGSNVPTLAEALDVIGNKLVYIELKESGCIEPLLKILKKFPKARVRIASFKHDELEKLKPLVPKLKIYALERTKPFDIIHNAKRLNLDGIGLNFWLLNPLTYYLVKKAGLDIYVYTVNNRFQAKFLNLLYKDIAICTDYPERFIAKTRKSK